MSTKLASDNKLAWRADPDTLDWLDGRAERAATQESPSLRARTELALWRAVLAEELRRQRWTLPELGLIADICNGTHVPDAVGGSVGIVAAQVLSAPGRYAAKWGVDDEDDLGLRLTRLSAAADIALADAVARWWGTGAEHSTDGWATVGITTASTDVCEHDWRRINVERQIGYRFCALCGREEWDNGRIMVMLRDGG